eukprot:ANDGO_08008.mRNA.1 hypothetical protein SARC_03441
MADVDLLFQTQSLADIRELELKTSRELSQKQHELRGLVSNRYHDLLEATDVLSSMRTALSVTQTHLDRLLKTVEHSSAATTTAATAATTMRTLEEQKQKPDHAGLSLSEKENIETVLQSCSRLWKAVEAQNYEAACKIVMSVLESHAALSRSMKASDPLLARKLRQFMADAKRWAATLWRTAVAKLEYTLPDLQKRLVFLALVETISSSSSTSSSPPPASGSFSTSASAALRAWNSRNSAELVANILVRMRMEQLQATAFSVQERIYMLLSMYIDSERIVAGAGASDAALASPSVSPPLTSPRFPLLLDVSVAQRVFEDGLVAHWKQSVRHVSQLDHEVRAVQEFLRDPRIHSLADASLRTIKSVSVELNRATDVLEDHVVCVGVDTLDLSSLKVLVTRYRSLNTLRAERLLETASMHLSEVLPQWTALETTKLAQTKLKMPLDQIIYQLRTFVNFIVAKSEGRIVPPVEPQIADLEDRFIQQRLSVFSALLDSFLARYISLVVEEPHHEKGAPTAISRALSSFLHTAVQEVVSREGYNLLLILISGLSNLIWTRFMDFFSSTENWCLQSTSASSSSSYSDAALLQFTLDLQCVAILCADPSSRVSIPHAAWPASKLDPVSLGTNEPLIILHAAKYLAQHASTLGILSPSIADIAASIIAHTKDEPPLPSQTESLAIFCPPSARIPYLPVSDPREKERAARFAQHQQAQLQQQQQQQQQQQKSSTFSFVENVVGQRGTEWFSSFLQKR